MYPANSYYDSNNNNNDSLISSSYNTLDQTLPHTSPLFQMNSNSNHDDPLPHSFFYNMPSPYSHYENDDIFIQHIYDLYLQKQSEIAEINIPDPSTTGMAEYSDDTNEILGGCIIEQKESKKSPRMKTSKKDRHSKIETAQGPRDRRMRLSLQVARDFFDLQDTLGYNKASKTVEWLLSKSRDAIKDLTSCSANSPSSTSECEVFSQEKVTNLVSPSKDTRCTKASIRKSAFNPHAKESREKARERARVRTREKNKGDRSKNGLKTTMSHQMNHLGSWCQDEKNGYQIEMLDGVEELRSSMILNNDTHNDAVTQEHLFTDFNHCGDSWNAYNNTDLRY